MRHLVARFFRSLRPSPPSRAEDAWATGFLTSSEAHLYTAMSAGDRRHAVDGARSVEQSVPERFRRDAVEAALVHDVGKRHAHLGVIGRSLATAIGWLVRTEVGRRSLADRGGWLGSVGRYLRHDIVGAEEVAAAGGSALAASWTAGHHRPERVGSAEAPAAVVAALRTADHDF